jgi:hypothetical protein
VPQKSKNHLNSKVFPYQKVNISFKLWLMVEMKGLTREQIMKIYYTSTSEFRQWKRDNAHWLWENKKPE